MWAQDGVVDRMADLMADIFGARPFWKPILSLDWKKSNEDISCKSLSEDGSGGRCAARKMGRAEDGSCLLGTKKQRLWLDWRCLMQTRRQNILLFPCSKYRYSLTTSPCDLFPPPAMFIIRHGVVHASPTASTSHSLNFPFLCCLLFVEQIQCKLQISTQKLSQNFGIQF